MAAPHLLRQDKQQGPAMSEKTEPAENAAIQGDMTILDYTSPRLRKQHDPDVTFEEYYYYANNTRKEEGTSTCPRLSWRELLPGSTNVEAKPNYTNSRQVEITAETNPGNDVSRSQISDEEWTNASRAFRTASAGACE